MDPTRSKIPVIDASLTSPQASETTEATPAALPQSGFVARDRSQAVAAGRKLWVDESTSGADRGQQERGRKPSKRNFQSGSKPGGGGDVGSTDGSSTPGIYGSRGLFDPSRQTNGGPHHQQDTRHPGKGKRGGKQGSLRNGKQQQPQRDVHMVLKRSAAPDRTASPSAARDDVVGADEHHQQQHEHRYGGGGEDKGNVVRFSQPISEDQSRTVAVAIASATSVASMPPPTSTAPPRPRAAPVTAANSIPHQPFPDLFKTKPSTPQAPIKFIDRHMQAHPDRVLRLMSDIPGCFVVGVLGQPGVGKSTVLSAFGMPKSPVNPPATSTKTHGIDLYVTPERVILLDTQAILSPSTSDRSRKSSASVENTPTNVSQGNKAAPHPRMGTLEQIKSIKMTMLMMSVCHVVLLVSDKQHDAFLWNHVRKVEAVRAKLFKVPKKTPSQTNLVQPQPASQSHIRSSATGSAVDLENTHHPVAKSSGAHGSHASLLPAASSTPVGSDTYQPQIVYVENKSHTMAFSPEVHAELLTKFSTAFKDSDLSAFGLFAESRLAQQARLFQANRLKYQMGGGEVNHDVTDVTADQSSTCTWNANVVCLPFATVFNDRQLDLTQSLDDLLSAAGINPNHIAPSSFETTVRQLRDDILGIPRVPSRHDPHRPDLASRARPSPRQFLVSETDWVRSTSRVLETLRKLHIPQEFLSRNSSAADVTKGLDGRDEDDDNV